MGSGERSAQRARRGEPSLGRMDVAAPQVLCNAACNSWLALR
jgi:hypothetical protein